MRTILTAYTLSECMEAMSAYAAALEKQGGKNLIFCEDRLTLIAERALISATGGTFRSTVSTFARFLKTDEKTISKQGSVMAVGDVMTRLQRENALECFTTAAGVGNNAKCIYETLAQFSSSEITPETLKESVAGLEDGALKKKIGDLARIYEGYLDFLKTKGYLDESRYLSLLPERISADETLKDTNVFFLCFPSFTAQARSVVRATLARAKNVIGVFCAGEEEIYTNRALHTFTSVCNEFGKTKILPLGKPLDGVAETLRTCLFNPETTGKARVKTDKIHIFEAEDKMGEAEYIAVQIKRAMQEDPTLRYRDFALLVPDVSAYSLTIKRALHEYGVPYFIDEKRSLKHHPLSAFLLDCLRVVKEKYAPTAVQSLAQNPFFGESDEYRNYLLKYANYRGGAKKEIKTGELIENAFDIEKLTDARARMLKATQGIKSRTNGSEYVASIRKILIDFNAEERLNALTEKLSDVSQKSYLSQIYRALDKVLGEAELLTGNRELTVAEFAAILKDGLDATEISLIPLKSDSVFVGSVKESRIEKVRVLFAIGLTEDVPSVSVDAAIVSDKEIAKLAEVKTLLEPTVAEVNLRARESVCLNLCTFLDELHLTYPLSADGSEPAVSDIFRYVTAAFGEIPHKKELSAEEFPYACSSPAPAVRRLLAEKGAYEQTRGKTREKNNVKYSSIYTALDKLGVQEKDDYLMEDKGQVCVERGEELFFKDGKISPTALEAYFTCPFKNFVERGLQLKAREETAVLAVDTGNFIHELLEKTAQKASEIQTEEEMRAYALTLGAEIIKNPVYSAQSDTASGAVFAEKLLKEGADVAVAAYRQIVHSDFKVEETEKTVLTETLKGKIDRVDGTEKYLRVIDYKTGAIDDKAVSYYTGRKLQMQLYMSAIKGERVPAGVFYFPASIDYGDTENGKFQMKGFLNGDTEALLCGDKTLTEEKQSEYFPASLKNTRSKRVMPEATFRDFIDYSVFAARQGSAELKDGYIAPTPYGKSCEYCKYGGMCGFNRDACSPREEATIDPPQIAEIARKTREGKEK